MAYVWIILAYLLLQVLMGRFGREYDQIFWSELMSSEKLFYQELFGSLLMGHSLF